MTLSLAEEAEELLRGLPERLDHTFCPWAHGRPVEANEEVVAYVQLLPGAGTSVDELMAHASRNLTAYKRPSPLCPHLRPARS